MSVPKLYLVATILVGVALFCSLEQFSTQRERMLKLFNTCPLQWFSSSKANDDSSGIYNVISAPSDRIFTKDELAQYDGDENSLGLYLAILGRVYDVYKGQRFYAKDGGYGFFRAKDGTKAFMTGEFNEAGLIDDTEGLSLPQMIELEDWIKFYDENYTYKGKLVGNFYDEQGNPTDALMDTVRRIKEARQEKTLKDDEKKKFPPCNSSWKKDVGKKLWCTEKSGGVKRDWKGVPRELFVPGNEKGKCVCVRTSGPPSDDPSSDANRGDLDNPNLKVYDGCDAMSSECFFS